MSEAESVSSSFTEFAESVEPRLRRALCVALGRELGLEATAEALSYGWQNWDRLRAMDNPAGYLYRVGRSRVRSLHRWNGARRTLFEPVAPDRLPWVEPKLPVVVSRLSEQQRVAVVLFHCFEWTYQEIADLLDVTLTTVQKHTERGMRKLRRGMGVPE
jgi:RNA polymerase sigma-70 factor (ECF subfamily)